MNFKHCRSDINKLVWSGATESKRLHKREQMAYRCWHEVRNHSVARQDSFRHTEVGCQQSLVFTTRTHKTVHKFPFS
jgi:hypothetical protein